MSFPVLARLFHAHVVISLLRLFKLIFFLDCIDRKAGLGSKNPRISRENAVEGVQKDQDQLAVPTDDHGTRQNARADREVDEIELLRGNLLEEEEEAEQAATTQEEVEQEKRKSKLDSAFNASDDEE